MSISFRHIGRILNAGSSGGGSSGVSEVTAQHVSSAITAAAGDGNIYILAPVTGTLSAAEFNSMTALNTDDANYLTFRLINLGQDGLGATDMYSTGDANTTKTTGGSGIVASVGRDIVLNSNPANLVVTKGDRLNYRYTKTGTLASGNHLFTTTILTFTPSA